MPSDSRYVAAVARAGRGAGYRKRWLAPRPLAFPGPGRAPRACHDPGQVRILTTVMAVARAPLAPPRARRAARYPSGWSAVNPVVMTVTLVTQDGVPIDAVHLPPPAPRPGPAVRPGPDNEAPRDLAIVIAHGFTMTWQRPMVWKLVQGFNRTAGVVTFDFRGHGRSGGLSTLGDKEIHDLDVAVRYARELGYRRVALVGFSMGASVALRQAALLGGADAVVSVSGPGRWYYRGTVAMRRVHLAAEKRLGRAFAKRVLNTEDLGRGLARPRPDAARRGGGHDLPGAGADHPRRPGHLLPARARPAALRRGQGAEGAVDAPRLRPRRAAHRRRPHRPHRRLGRPRVRRFPGRASPRPPARPRGRHPRPPSSRRPHRPRSRPPAKPRRATSWSGAACPRCSRRRSGRRPRPARANSSRSRRAGVGARRCAAPATIASIRSSTPGRCRVQVHPRGRDPLLEQRLAGPLERRVVRRAQPHRPGRRHAEALLVQPAAGVAERVAGRLVACRRTTSRS